MKKPAIPPVNVSDQRIASLLRPIKENIEVITGARGGSLAELPTNATLADVISRVNAIIARLNA